MARELWPLVALPVALAALAASLAVRPFLPDQVGSRPQPSTAALFAGRASPDKAAPEPVQQVRPEAPEPRRLVARVSGSLAVRSRPGGAVAQLIGSRTEFGSPRALGVVRRKGRWLGVTLPELGNGRLGWVDVRSSGLRVAATAVAIQIDLSAHRLALLRGDHVVRRLPVTIGAPGSPTPTGRFAVTDKLPGARYSSAYGCCILALSGRQPTLPPGWTGGDRLAIHGAPAGQPIGRAASAGCLHAAERDLRALMRTVPLGTPVLIRA